MNLHVFASDTSGSSPSPTVAITYACLPRRFSWMTVFFSPSPKVSRSPRTSVLPRLCAILAASWSFFLTAISANDSRNRRSWIRSSSSRILSSTSLSSHDLNRGSSFRSSKLIAFRIHARHVKSSRAHGEIPEAPGVEREERLLRHLVAGKSPAVDTIRRSDPVRYTILEHGKRKIRARRARRETTSPAQGKVSPSSPRNIPRGEHAASMKAPDHFGSSPSSRPVFEPRGR